MPPPLNPHSPTVNSDLALVKVGPDGVYQWHTFYGTSEFDGPWPVTVGPDGAVYLGGYSMVTWLGPEDTEPLNAHHGDLDILVMKLVGQP